MKRTGWFADICNDDDETDPVILESWQPCLQVDGAVHSFDVWFATRKDCEAYIRDEILGRGMIDEPAMTPVEEWRVVHMDTAYGFDRTSAEYPTRELAEFVLDGRGGTLQRRLVAATEWEDIG